MGKPGKVTERKTYPQWDSNQILVDLGVDNAMERYVQYKETIEHMEANKKELGMELEGYFKAAELSDGVRFGEYVFSPRTSTTGSKIDATLLLENGVDADTIAASTVPGRQYTYMDCRKDKPTNVPSK